MAQLNRPQPSPPSDPLQEGYDAVAYPTHAQEAVHPGRMAVVGRLAGLNPAPIDRCRVLEVGCGDGGNVIPIAVQLPDSTFVGVDFAAAPVARGQELVRELGLANIDLRQGDIRTLGDELGQFDYIIGHGVYSWVPEDVREALLALCRARLTEQGIALISYNAMPGGHIRQMIREMLFFHLRDTREPAERIKEGRIFLQMLLAAGGSSGVPDTYRDLLLEQVRMVAAREEAGFFHDELAPINEPFYITQFLSHAARHGLQYVGDTEFYSAQEQRFPDEIAAPLADLGQRSMPLKEQYIDFFTCSQFHKTLLCRSETELDHSFQPNVLTSLWVASDAAPGEPDAQGKITFASQKRGSIATGTPLVIAAMRALHEAWPAALSFSALLDASLPADPALTRFKAGAGLALFLYRTYGAGVIELYTHPPHVVREPAERPLASPLARLQAARGLQLVNLRHEEVDLAEEADRTLLGLLDGTRDRAALAEALAAAGHGTGPGALEAQLRNLGVLGLLIS